MEAVPALLERLRSGRRLDRQRAVTQLMRLSLQSSPEQCEAMVDAGCIGALLETLRSPSSSELMKAQAATALNFLTSASQRGCHMVARHPGGIAALVASLSSSNDAARTMSAVVLQSVSFRGPEYAQQIADAGGIEPVLRLCRCGVSADGEGSAMALAACGVLCNLARAPDARAAVMSAGAMPFLVRVLEARNAAGNADSPDLKAVALAIRNLVRDSSTAQAAVSAGAPAPLVHLLRASRMLEVQAAAAGALSNLAGSQDTAVCGAIAEAGGIPVLAARLCSSDGTLVQACAKALYGLGSSSAAPCAAIATAGCARRLVQLLAGGGSTAIAQSAACLAVCILSDEQTAAAALVAAGAAPALVALLRGGQGDESVQRPAALALCSLAYNHAEALLAAGAAPVLEQLRQTSSSDWGMRMEAAEALEALRSTASQAAGQPANSSRPRRPPRICANPGCDATHGLRRCRGCSAVRYCGEACNRAHWKAHRAECRQLRAEREQAEEAASRQVAGEAEARAASGSHPYSCLA